MLVKEKTPETTRLCGLFSLFHFSRFLRLLVAAQYGVCDGFGSNSAGAFIHVTVYVRGGTGGCVAQLTGYGQNIQTVMYHQTGGRMPESVGVDVLKTVAFAEISQPSRKGIRTNRATVISGKYISRFLPAVTVDSALIIQMPAMVQTIAGKQELVKENNAGFLEKVICTHFFRHMFAKQMFCEDKSSPYDSQFSRYCNKYLQSRHSKVFCVYGTGWFERESINDSKKQLISFLLLPLKRYAATASQRTNLSSRGRI